LLTSLIAESRWDSEADCLSEGPSSRDIDVGFLVRGDRATLEGMRQYQAPEGLFSRPPLMITMTLHTASAGDVTVYGIVNHFISKSGGEVLTEPSRVMEAEWNAGLNAGYPPPDPDDPSARHLSDHDPVVAVFEVGE